MKIKIALLIIGSYLFLMGISCQQQSEKVATEKKYLNLSDSVHYIGMQNCRQCHENIYQTFIQTGMGKSFEKASKKKSSGKFDEHALVYDKFNNFYYKPFWSQDSLKIMEFRLSGKDTIHKRIQTIQYIVGSGQHTNSHIFNAGNYLYQAPLTFYTQKGKWDLPPGFENGSNTRFSRIIGLECLSCHNAYPQFIEGSENKFTEVPQGIDCERCHGPGSLHVKEKKEGKIIDIKKDIDYTIVNPGKMPTEMQFQICQRCHLQGNAVLKEGHSFYDFRPGMKLSDVMYVFMPEYAGAEKEFIMASHVERLKMSKCYLETQQTANPKDGLSCISCHNPHISVKKIQNEVFNTVCQKCHSPSPKNNICTLDLEKRNSKNNNCVGCHMAKSGTIDIPHVISTDHYIRKPENKEQLASIKKFIRLRCINEPNPPKIETAKAYINYYEKFSPNSAFLDSAATYMQNPQNTDIRIQYKTLVHLAYLQKNYTLIIKYAEEINPINMLKKKSWTNEDAYAAYRTGDAYYNMGMTEKAIPYFQRAILLAPFIPQFQNRYGSCLMQRGNVAEAKNIFQQLRTENKNYLPAISNLGYAYLINDKDTGMAAKLYNETLEIDPDNESAILNKAGLYIYKNQFSVARKLLMQASKKKPQDTHILEILESIKNMQDVKPSNNFNTIKR